MRIRIFGKTINKTLIRTKKKMFLKTTNKNKQPTTVNKCFSVQKKLNLENIENSTTTSSSTLKINNVEVVEEQNNNNDVYSSNNSLMNETLEIRMSESSYENIGNEQQKQQQIFFGNAVDQYVFQNLGQMVFWKSNKEKQLEEELTKIKEEFNEHKEFSERLVKSCEEKNAQLLRENSQIKELLDTKTALDNAGDVIMKMEEELKCANADMAIKEAMLIDKQNEQEKSDNLIADLKKKIKQLEDDKLKLCYDQGTSVGTSGTGYQRFTTEQLAALNSLYEGNQWTKDDLNNLLENYGIRMEVVFLILPCHFISAS
ncbi:unnamed protein product [Meloidogyne enterolobii]|uniref:Uncharacterized protein n=1 Tax=Meloidogyne enterolobii TaxID=390850 RepID=A0ACB0YZ72_MELEN